MISGRGRLAAEVKVTLTDADAACLDANLAVAGLADGSLIMDGITQRGVCS